MTTKAFEGLKKLTWCRCNIRRDLSYSLENQSREYYFIMTKPFRFATVRNTMRYRKYMSNANLYNYVDEKDRVAFDHYGPHTRYTVTKL